MKASAPAAGALSSSKWVFFALLFSAYASYKLRELRKSPFRTLFSGYLSFLRLCLLALGATSLLSSTLLAGDLQSVARTLFQRWKTIVILFAVPPYATFKTLYEVGILGRRTSKRWTIRMEWFVRLLRSPPWAVTYMCNGDGTAYLTEVVSAFGKCGTLLDGYNLWLCRANFPQLRIQRQLVGVQSEPCPMTWYEFPGECVPGTERSWWVKLFGGQTLGGPRDLEITVRGEKTVKMGDPGFDSAPPAAHDPEAGLLFYCHGGGYNCFTGDSHAELVGRILWKFRRRHGKRLTACLPNYRRPPEYPFPTAVNDCVAALLFIYRTCPKYTPANTYFMGDSAGGALCVSVQLVLKQRRMEHLLPQCSVLLSPWVNLSDTGYSPPTNTTPTDADHPPRGVSPSSDSAADSSDAFSGDSASRQLEFPAGEREHETLSAASSGATAIRRHLSKDARQQRRKLQAHQKSGRAASSASARGEQQQIKQNLCPTDFVDAAVVEYCSLLYVGGAGNEALRKHPLASPTYGDLSRLPPMLIQAGGGEKLYKQIVKFAYRCFAHGVDVRLLSYEDMPHVFQFFTPFMELSQQAHTHVVDFLGHVIEGKMRDRGGAPGGKTSVAGAGATTALGGGGPTAAGGPLESESNRMNIPGLEAARSRNISRSSFASEESDFAHQAEEAHQGGTAGRSMGMRSLTFHALYSVERERKKRMRDDEHKSGVPAGEPGENENKSRVHVAVGGAEAVPPVAAEQVSWMKAGAGHVELQLETTSGGGNSHSGGASSDSSGAVVVPAYMSIPEAATMVANKSPQLIRERSQSHDSGGLYNYVPTSSPTAQFGIAGLRRQSAPCAAPGETAWSREESSENIFRQQEALEKKRRKYLSSSQQQKRPSLRKLQSYSDMRSTGKNVKRWEPLRQFAEP